jgi:hypothetical protein
VHWTEKPAATHKGGSHSKLVDDHLMVTLVAERLAAADVRTGGFVLDGFPRTVEQAPKGLPPRTTAAAESAGSAAAISGLRHSSVVTALTSV